MKYIFFLFLIVCFACTGKQTKLAITQKTLHNKTTSIENKIVPTVQKESVAFEIYETFIDSLNIGRKGKCKVEIVKFFESGEKHTIIDFFTKNKNLSKNSAKWIIQNHYSFINEAITGLETTISDFNNDSFNDMTFVSATAARGANEVRRLFIYDDKKQKLIAIKNSEEYPNMLYNKQLDCIDAFLVYGGCSTVFLKIEGDSLRKFANVECFDDLTVSTYNKKGVEKIIYKKTDVNENYVRYKNFRPLKQYDDD